MPEEVPEFLISKEYIRMFIDGCDRDIADGLNPHLVAEGQRLADNFRKMFPNVSDKDLGTLIITFCKALVMVADAPAISVSDTINQIASGYTYAAAEIMRGVMAIEDMTS